MDGLLAWCLSCMCPQAEDQLTGDHSVPADWWSECIITSIFPHFSFSSDRILNSLDKLSYIGVQFASKFTGKVRKYCNILIPLCFLSLCQWFSLSDVKHGRVHMILEWLPTVTQPDRLQKVIIKADIYNINYIILIHIMFLSINSNLIHVQCIYSRPFYKPYLLQAPPKIQFQ